MKPSIWKKCINCKVNCCKQKKISCNLFLTEEEKKRLKKINDAFPCKFLNNNGLCEIHSQRPIDCRFYPFDIVEVKKEFYWAYYQTSCPIIIGGGKHDLELCLKDFELRLMPKFKKYIKAYSHHRMDEFISNFGPYIVLRRVRIRSISAKN